MIARRAFVLAVAGSFFGAPLGAAAQQAVRVYRIGSLAFGSREPTTPYFKAFEDGLRELGYVEGRNIAIERRFAEGKTERLPDLAAELVRLKVDVIMAWTAFAYFPESAARSSDRSRVEAVSVGHVVEPADAVAVAACDEAEPTHGLLVAA